jgi:tetratricopeptide (TPR) repeat protein
MNPRIAKLTFLLFFWSLSFWADAQPYLLQNNDTIQQKIVEFFRVNKPEIWVFHKHMNLDLYDEKLRPCSSELYKPLKEYDSVFIQNGFLKFTFLNGREASLSLNEKPSFLRESDKCVALFAPPLGWGDTRNGAIWGRYWISNEKGLARVLTQCNSELEEIRKREMYRVYWDDFDIKLEAADPGLLTAPITEEQRKLIVMANAAGDEKEYTAALSFYYQLLEQNPYGYPDAYFNIALIAANMNNYVLAISNMKKYILLVPNAKDSRTAQDKIYEWEYKLNK